MKRKLESLSASQSEALSLVEGGENVFITGGAGTGKSYLIAQIMERLRGMGKKVTLVSSTGVSAYNIGGVTLHSFAGIGLGEGDFEVLYMSLLKKKERVKKWRAIDTLIVDEISMITTVYMKRVDRVARRIRKSKRPFGGIQLIMVGDFFQCPSIIKPMDVKKFEEYENDEEAFLPLFETRLWREELKIHSKALKENFRQAGDTTFIELLSRIRVAQTLPEDEAIFQGRLLSHHPDVDPEELVKLCSRRDTAEAINRKAMLSLTGETHHFKAVHTHFDKQGKPMTPLKDMKTATFPVDADLELKVGAKVMLCYNMDAEIGLFNGARGEVISFERNSMNVMDSVLYPMVNFEDVDNRLILPYSWDSVESKRLVSTFTQVPLILRYAITIHKAQGLTISKLLVGMDFFEHGQGYVAFSRAPKLDVLYLSNVNSAKFLVSPSALKFYTENRLL